MTDMTTSRQRVLNYLRRQNSATAVQIGHALNMSAANVRHHLGIMLDDGRIAELSQTRGGGRGRPVKLYGLSQKLLGDNLSLLADALLEELLKGLSPAQQEKMIHKIGSILARQFNATDIKTTSAKRLSIVIEKLNELHYQGHWEAGARGPRLLFGHCPYASIIAKHPELCRMDERLVGATMQQSARQISKIGVGAAQTCIFEFD